MERQTIAAGGEVAVADEVFGGIGIGARRQKDGGDNREKRDCQGCTNPVSETRLGVWQPHGDFDDEWLRRLLRRKGFTAQQVRTWKSPPNGRSIVTFVGMPAGLWFLVAPQNLVRANRDAMGHPDGSRRR